MKLIRVSSVHVVSIRRAQCGILRYIGWIWLLLCNMNNVNSVKSQTGSVRTQLIAHDKEVYDMAFDRGKDIFASVGADGSLRTFDLRFWNIFWRIEALIYLYILILWSQEFRYVQYNIRIARQDTASEVSMEQAKLKLSSDINDRNIISNHSRYQVNALCGLVCGVNDMNISLFMLHDGWIGGNLVKIPI